MVVPNSSDVDPRNLVNADLDPNLGQVQVNRKYFSKHFSIFRSKKNLLTFKSEPKP